jgi:hypothetical protein
LTYACPQDKEDNPIATKEELLAHFYTLKIKIEGYVVAEEQHDNEKRHYHVYLKLQSKCDIKNARFFDFKTVHPRVEECNEGWITYCTKTDNYLLDNVIKPAEKSQTKKMKDESWAKAIDLAKDGKIKDALAHLQQWQPKEYLRCAAQYRQNLTDVHRSAKFFREPPKIMEQNWIEEIETLDIKLCLENEDFPRTHIFIGNQGIGKTEAAKYIMKKAGFVNPLIVNQPEDLKRLLDHDCFIYDECNVNSGDNARGVWSREDQINLVCYAEDRSIKARYTDIFIPRMTPRILTSNNLATCINFLGEGVNRRITVHEFGDTKLFKKS